MAEPKIQKEIAMIMALARDCHPEGVSFHRVMIELNCGATKARNLCIALGEAYQEYVYFRGKVRYLGDPLLDELTNRLDKDEADQAFPEDIDKLISPGEAARLKKILMAKPTPPEDKSFLQMPRRDKKKWKPSDDTY